MAIREMSLDVLRRTADVMGPSSAAAMALKDRERRLGLGEDVAIYFDPRTSTILVGQRFTPVSPPSPEPVETEP